MAREAGYACLGRVLGIKFLVLPTLLDYRDDALKPTYDGFEVPQQGVEIESVHSAFLNMSG